MLIETIEQLREVINLSKNATFDRMFTHLFNAEQKYVFPLIGSEMYNKLADFLNNPDSDLLTRSDMNTDFNTDFYVEVEGRSVAYARLLYICQQSIAHLAFYEGFDILNAIVDETGFKRIETTEKKTLFKYQEDNIRTYYKETGLNLLDNLLLILEANLTHFPEYAEQYAVNKAKIIPNTASFNRIINIRNSRLIYLRLLQHMKKVEELELAPVLGVTNMATIYAGLAQSTVPGKVAAILPYIQNYVAWSSSVLLMQESGADLTDRGLYFEGIKGGISMNDVKQPASDSRVTELVLRNKTIAMHYMQALKNFLLANASDWGDYDNPRNTVHNHDNTGKKNFWV